MGIATHTEACDLSCGDRVDWYPPYPKPGEYVLCRKCGQPAVVRARHMRTGKVAGKALVE